LPPALKPCHFFFVAIAGFGASVFRQVSPMQIDMHSSARTVVSAGYDDRAAQGIAILGGPNAVRSGSLGLAGRRKHKEREHGNSNAGLHGRLRDVRYWST
jgi:hypothetical protein